MERVSWPNKLEYHLSLFSYVIGLCTFWRFPYLSYENNGAPFLYAFLVLYILVGIPLVFIDMAWGQYSNLVPLQAFKIVPVMQGIGVCVLFLSCFLLVYFGVISYYLLIYLTASFGDPLPWISCGHPWNTAKCQLDFDATCVIQAKGNRSSSLSCNYTYNGSYTSPSVEYWTENLMGKDNLCNYYPSITTALFGKVPSTNVLLSPVLVFVCFFSTRLLVSWIAMAKHVKLTGKVNYLLSTFPFAVSVMMLVRCVTLSGSMVGIHYLFVPTDLDAFFSPKLWKDALGQVFLSLLVTWGGLLTWSSYNKFYNKYHVDAAVLLSVVPFLSVLSATSMFAVVGFLASGSGVAPGLALRDAKGPMAPIVAMSEALAQMWGYKLPWCMVVFVTFFLSSTSTLLPCMECILSSMSDTFPIFRRLLLRNLLLFLLLLFSSALYYVPPCFFPMSGLQMIEFFDTFVLVFCLTIIAIFQLLLLCYAFGFRLLGTNTKAMTRNSCLKSHFWTVMWGGLTPLVLVACLGFSIYGMATEGVRSLAPTLPETARGDWTTVAGAVTVGFMLGVLVVVGVVRVARTRGSYSEKVRNAFAPQHSRTGGGNGAGGVDMAGLPSNGQIFMSGYSSHRGEHRGIEVLVDDDIVTTV